MFQSAIHVAADAEPAFTSVDVRSLAQVLDVTKPRHIAIIGGYAPRRCGIATFTADTLASLEADFPGVNVDVYPMQPPGEHVPFEPPARMAITENDPASFARAALAIERSNPDVVWLQHEFGLFGGDAGDCILPLIDAIIAPLIVTFHTVLPQPDVHQMRVMRRLVTRASKIVVMSSTSMDLMREVYGASDDQLALIPHGTPDRPFGRAAKFKAQFGLEHHRVLMTFGLLSPGKGIENMIVALPAIVARHPDTIYNIVGATHPNLVAREGEAYRESLRQRAEQLGVSANIRWIDAFLDQDELLDHLEAADIYITPYLGAGQATSGTLAYAVALGKAVISTPYVHARELLAANHGILVPFNDSAALSHAITTLLDDPDALNAYQRRAYARGRHTIWSQVATDTMAMIDAVVDTNAPLPIDSKLPPMPAFDGIQRLSDDTGMVQHSILSIPDRRHGYCIDDNARALMLMNHIAPPHTRDAARLSMTYAAFVQHAWNPDTRHFRNFMGFSREWLEDVGSLDSNGRTLWALASTARLGQSAPIRSWARRLYDEASANFALHVSPRATAFSALAADQILVAHPDNLHAHTVAEQAGEFLIDRFDRSARPGWHWFEASLAYDNCRLSEAIIRLGLRLDHPDWVDCGMRSLAWINDKQTGAGGRFRPIGSDGFGVDGATLPFDQQPVEVWATIDAADAAYEATGDRNWIKYAQAAYQWFHGANDRGVILADVGLGTCRDGITPRGENLNEGAESTLAYHLSHVALCNLVGKAEARTNGRGFLRGHIG